jgi:phage FluMu gp28-like protein
MMLQSRPQQAYNSPKRFSLTVDLAGKHQLESINLLSESQEKSTNFHMVFKSCSSALPSARQKSVFAYPKQSATVLVGSVLK